MKKIVTAIAVVTLAVSLTACTRNVTHRMDDGRVVHCVSHNNYGIDCDFEGAK